MADIWSDGLAELQAESLLTHCKGEANVWGDIPSRWPIHEARNMLAEELQKISMHDMSLVHNEVSWKIPGIGTAIPDLRIVADMCIAHNLKETGKATALTENKLQTSTFEAYGLNKPPRQEGQSTTDELVMTDDLQASNSKLATPHTNTRN
jgi:hypothetical protein